MVWICEAGLYNPRTVRPNVDSENGVFFVWKISSNSPAFHFIHVKLHLFSALTHLEIWVAMEQQQQHYHQQEQEQKHFHHQQEQEQQPVTNVISLFSQY